MKPPDHYLYFMSAVLQGVAAILAVMSALFVFSSQALRESVRIAKWHELQCYLRAVKRGGYTGFDHLDQFLSIPITFEDLNEIRAKLETREQYKTQVDWMIDSLTRAKRERDYGQRLAIRQNRNFKLLVGSSAVDLLFLIWTSLFLAYPPSEHQPILCITLAFFALVVALSGVATFRFSVQS